MEEKDYTIDVNLKFTNLITAESKEHAKYLIKENFINDYNLVIEDNEIIFEEDKNIYNSTYDYDDMKIAICVKDFVEEYRQKLAQNGTIFDFTTFEKMITLAQEIKNNWLIDDSMSNLREEEHAYIQTYAYRYLKEKYLD